MAAASWIELLRTDSAREAREAALVLEARGIPHFVHVDGTWHVVLVSERDGVAAREELRRFGEENRDWPPRPARLRLYGDGIPLALAYGVLVTALFQMQIAEALGRDWVEAGLNSAGRVRAGEWWRTITALTLHSDVTHLAGNVVFGAIFLAAAGQLLGNGAGALAVLLAGALGNAANAFLKDPGARSLGASTAVFGALGLVIALLFLRRRGRAFTPFQRWTPIAVGVLLLAWHGLSGERTDVAAHVLGFGAGLLLAAPLAPAERWLARRSAQRLCAALCLGAIAGAWTRAFA